VVYRVLAAVFVGVSIALAALWIGAGLDRRVTSSDAAAAALRWVGNGVTEQPRHDGDNWEVDVVRRDGSMVQVSLGPRLELRDFDEEYGPAGTPAADELKGAARARAVRVAFAETGPAQVVSVERDSRDSIEVSVRESDGDQVEVELNHMFRIVAVQEEDPSDE
jgi:hypothetical protein